MFNPSNFVQPQTQNLPMTTSNVTGYDDKIGNILQILNNPQPQAQNSPQTQTQLTTPFETPPTPASTPQIQTPAQEQKPVTSDEVNAGISLGAINGAQNPTNSYDVEKLARLGLNDANKQFAYGIIRAKNDYSSAPEGKSGDAQRQVAADYANYIRKLAQMRGVDLGAFGDGSQLTTDQANLAWGNYVLDEAEKYQNKFQAVQDNLKNNYGENSNDHFWRLYDEYRQQGYGDRQAAILAGRETTVYQQKRKDYLVNAINEYGIVNGNSLNQFGVNTLAQIAEEDNIMGTAIAQGFETPKGNYEKMQAMALQRMKDIAAADRKQSEILANKLITEYVQGQTNNRTAQTNQTKIDVAEINQGGAAERQKKLFEQQKFLAEYNAEVQANLKILENSLKAEGGGDVTKTGDYKVAKDTYDRVYTRYNDLLNLLNKDTSMMNEN